jgi:hypothetical protein
VSPSEIDQPEVDNDEIVIDDGGGGDDDDDNIMVDGGDDDDDDADLYTDSGETSDSDTVRADTCSDEDDDWPDPPGTLENTSGWVTDRLPRAAPVDMDTSGSGDEDDDGDGDDSEMDIWDAPYLVVPMDKIESNCKNPIKYLKYLVYAVMGRECVRLERLEYHDDDTTRQSVGDGQQVNPGDSYQPVFCESTHQ